MSPPHVVRRLLVALALLAVLTLGATVPAGAVSAPARPVTMSVPSPAGAPAVSPDDADDHADDFGWGPSRVVWGGFGWLGVVLVTAILLRRRASRRR